MASKHRGRDFQADEILDRFRLQKLLGRGAFGQVWLAVDEGGFGFQKQVALKILTDVTKPRRVESLMREARICGGLHHPHVIDVYGVGQVDGAVFIVMEYVEGETLASLWKDLDFLGVKFPKSVVCDLGIAVAEALHHAWTATDAEGRQLGIVHRDLKPANIMISNRGVAKVGDFGVAKAMPEPSHTFTGRLKGTPSYLAPEVWQGSREFKAAVDLFSLGVILWELVVAKRYYGAVKITEIFDIVKNRTAEEDAALVELRFPPLAAVVERLLQRDPQDRYQSALEVAEDLRRIRHDLGPAGDLQQFMRLVRSGRLDPLDRNNSLLQLPALPPQALDWLPLLEIASDTGAHSFDEIEPVTGPEQLGPSVADVPGPRADPVEVDLAESAQPEPEPAQEPAPIEDSAEDVVTEKAPVMREEPREAPISAADLAKPWSPPAREPTPAQIAVLPPEPAVLPLEPVAPRTPEPIDVPPAEPPEQGSLAPWFIGGGVLLLIGVVLWLVSMLRS
jgi:eukaryotic-like serine/threonine-protein kinase